MASCTAPPGCRSSVAVTSVAVSNGQMSQANSSLLVAGGALTVLLLPMTATLLDRSDLTEEPTGAPHPIGEPHASP